MFCPHRKFFVDSNARIPFAFVALVILILSFASVIYVMKIQRESTQTSLTHPVEPPYELSRRIQEDIETQAYYIVLDELLNLSMTTGPNLTLLNPNTMQRFGAYLKSHYPRIIDRYNVSVLSHTIYVIVDLKNTTDFIEIANTTHAKPHIAPGNNELYTQIGLRPNTTQRAVYLRVVGTIQYRVFDMKTNLELRNSFRFDKNLYSTVPMLRENFEIFQANANGDEGDIGRMTRFILTTLAQYRVLIGNASGGYNNNVNTGGLDTILRVEDVELALNLALVLETARLYRTWDNNTTDALGLSALVSNYVSNGTVDPADIIALVLKLEREQFNVGKVLAQTIYTFGERFVYELLDLFWNDEKVDPVLKEPVVNWAEVQAKGEDWARAQLKTWLDKFRAWLGIPANLQGREAKATITEPASNGYRIYYFRPPNPPHDPGAQGYYYVFNHAPSKAPMQGLEWTIKSYDVADTRELILGNASNLNLLPDPYVLEFSDNFNPFNDPSDGTRTVRYYLVKDSLVKKHDRGRGTPYFDALYDILETLNRSMRHKSVLVDDTVNKGFMDTVAHDIADDLGVSASNIKIDPKDIGTILVNDTKNLILKTNGAISAGLTLIENRASDFNTRNEWWREGAYKDTTTTPYDQNLGFFIYSLTKETVDLWYEAFVNLYEGGTGPFSSVPNPTPPDTEQYSQWMTGTPRGSFNFRNDALRDIFHRIKNVADPHRTVFDDFAWEGIPEPPALDEFAIVAQAATEWPDIRIWTTAQRNIDTDSPRAVEAVVGTQGLITEIDGAKKNLDMVTDSGQYRTEFYNFVAAHIGKPIIGDNFGAPCLVLNLTMQNGWLDELIRKRMTDYIFDNADLNNLEFFQPVMMTEYRFYDGALSAAARNGTILNETLKVWYEPKVLRNNSGIDVKILVPRRGHHFVDVQSGNMTEMPFVTEWHVEVRGVLKLFTRSDRRLILRNGLHYHSWYNDTLHINLSFNVSIYSGWNLESDWNTCDVAYNYTRGWFGITGRDYDPTIPDPCNHGWYQSRNLSELLYAVKDCADWIGDGATKLAQFTSALPDKSVGRSTPLAQQLDNATGTTLRLINDTTSSNYMQYLEKRKNALATASRWISIFEFPIFGHNLSLAPYTQELVMGLNTSSEQCLIRFEFVPSRNIVSNTSYKTANFSWNYRLSPSLLQWHQIWRIYGKEYRGYIRTPDQNLVLPKEVMISSVGRPLTGLYIPMLDKKIAVLDFGILIDGNVPSWLKNTLQQISVNMTNSLESMIAGVKVLFGTMLNKSSDFAVRHSVGLYFRLKFDGKNRDIGVAIELRNTTGQSVKKYFIWIINSIRSIVYNLGNPELPTAIYAIAPRSNVTQLYLSLYDFRPEIKLYQSSNIPATAAGIAGLGPFEKPHIEFGTYTNQGWSTHGAVWTD